MPTLIPALTYTYMHTERRLWDIGEDAFEGLVWTSIAITIPWRAVGTVAAFHVLPPLLSQRKLDTLASWFVVSSTRPVC